MDKFPPTIQELLVIESRYDLELLGLEPGLVGELFYKEFLYAPRF
jgi:hypothetical protein